MQTYRHYHNLLEDTDAINTVISVAELLRSEAEGEGDAKTSMNSFLNMLQNAGLNINYDGLKAYYDSDPRLQAEIQDFNIQILDYKQRSKTLTRKKLCS